MSKKSLIPSLTNRGPTPFHSTSAGAAHPRHLIIIKVSTQNHLIIHIFAMYTVVDPLTSIE